MSANVLGIIVVDLSANGIGLPSLALDKVGGQTVLEWTLHRLRRCRNVPRWILSVPGRDIEKVRSFAGPDWSIEPIELAPPPWRERVRRGRKWSLDGWRGGVGRASLLDEECHPAEFTRLARKHSADWIVQARAEGPLVDPAYTDALVERALTTDPPRPLVYGAIPPGLAAWPLKVDFLEELAAKNLFPGFVLGYRAWEPTVDLTEQLFSYKPPLQISRFPHRLLADHRMGFEFATTLGDAIETLDASAVVERAEQWFDRVAATPEEIEIEITTRRSLPHRYLPTVCRPDMTIADFFRITRDFASQTDHSLVTIGGHGDPLEHPQWRETIDAASAAGAYGLSLATDGLRLDDSAIAALCQSELDILEVRVDAAHSSTYQALRGVDRLQEVSSAIERLTAQERRPLVVASMIRSSATVGEMIDFFDRWSTKADAAVIVGHRDFAGQMPSDPVLNLEPPARGPCRRLWKRMMIHSDGSIVSCGEDFSGKQVIAPPGNEGPIAAWTNAALTELRQFHQSLKLGHLELCTRCREWHRP